MNAFVIELEDHRRAEPVTLDEKGNIWSVSDGKLHLSLDWEPSRGYVWIKGCVNKRITVKQEKKFYDFTKEEQIINLRIGPEAYSDHGDYGRWDTMILLASAKGFSDQRTAESLALIECMRHLFFREAIRKEFPDYYESYTKTSGFRGTIVAQCIIYTDDIQDRRLTHYLDVESLSKTTWSCHTMAGHPSTPRKEELLRAKEKLTRCLQELEKTIEERSQS